MKEDCVVCLQANAANHNDVDTGPIPSHVASAVAASCSTLLAARVVGVRQLLTDLCDDCRKCFEMMEAQTQRAIEAANEAEDEAEEEQ
jgi:hypothetical protein